MKSRTTATAAALLLTLTALTTLGATTPAASAPRSLSIVQLGDSIASGEGTLYGYTYDSTSRRWTGGNLNVAWPGPDPACHVSPDA